MAIGERLQQAAEELGFECTGVAAASELVSRPEVRAMCASGSCRIYGHSWACPPACLSIEEYQQKFANYEKCLVVQTVGELEDEFDGETMMEAEATHKERFTAFAKRAHDIAEEEGAAVLCLSAGTCTICRPCTYPDEPCRFPDRRMSSMEASGLYVAEVCGLAGIPYNHGKLSIAYVSCVLY